jgi:putative sigma-54 modulation protein
VTTHISGRGVVVSPLIRRHVEGKLAKVSRFIPKLTEARVVLGHERYRRVAEVTLQAKRATLHAKAAAPDFHAAVDGALESLAQQARRRKDRIQARKPRAARRPPADVAATAPGGDPGEEEATPSLVVRRISPKPMSVDEALEQMRVREDSLLIFTNAKSRAVNLLRRRADGVFELVEPAD